MPAGEAYHGDHAIQNSASAAAPLTAGFVDTAGFLALQGLFTAHVTGNLVTLGAALVFGTSGVVAKLLALPAFCMVVIATRLLSSALPRGKLPALEALLVLKVLLPAAGAALAISRDVKQLTSRRSFRGY